MALELLDRETLRIALIGMPRSGSTIITAAVNSIGRSLVLGEPHGLARAQRPPGMSHVANILETEYGLFELKPNFNVLEQIKAFAQNLLIPIYGFKECLVTRTVDPIRLVEGYGDELDMVLVTLRTPRKNYMSMLQMTNPAHIPVTAFKFATGYMELAEYTRKPNVHAIFLDRFRHDPVGELRRATGLNIVGDLEFKKFAGGGDVTARVAKKVYMLDRRASWPGESLDDAVIVYDQIWSENITGS